VPQQVDDDLGDLFRGNFPVGAFDASPPTNSVATEPGIT
jgi:hypothetical protein